MNAHDVLIRQIERGIDSLFRAARALPADRLTWSPVPGARSALDQLQEIATIGGRGVFADAHLKRKMEWDPEKMAQWKSERAKITDLNELERMTRESCADLFEAIRNTESGDLSATVEMPFPGDFTLADIYSYYSWNMGYHEGQINYIASLVEAEQPTHA